MATQHDMVNTFVPLTFMYKYRVGQYLEKYHKGLEEKVILGVKCPSCGRVVVPPRSTCGRCYVGMEEWVELGQEGTVENFTMGHVRIEKGDIKDLDEPVLIGQIRLDGADSLLTHEIRGVKPEDLKTGIKVRAHWKDEPKGKLRDLEYFEPA